MGDDYWSSSKVTDAAKTRSIFDQDESNDLNRFKTQSNRLVDDILNGDRTTAPTKVLGGTSTRQFAPSTPVTAVAAVPMPSSTTTAIPRSFVPSAESARAHRAPTPSASSNGTHDQTKWLPVAEEYPEQKVKDGSTQYDREMELRCRDLLEKKDVSLNDIRDYDKKVSLLRVAVQLNIPKVTVPVIIFLENSLSRPLFYELIKKYPSAAKNYMNMVKLRVENDYYIAMLKQFGRNEDVAMIRIRQASQTKDSTTKMAILDQAAIELASHPWWRSQIAEQQELLKKQRNFQMSMASSSNPVRLENGTALETYKLIFETEFRRQKPMRTVDPSAYERSSLLENVLHMSRELTMCGKLSAIMHCGLHGHYEDFLNQAINQGLFGKKYVIAPEYLADMVHNWVQYTGESGEKANEKTARLLNMISDPTKRMYYAEKFQNYDVAIDTIVNVLRDRMELESLRRRMPRDHPSYVRITSLLENTKWKN